METIKYYSDIIFRKKWLILSVFLIVTPISFLGLQKSGIVKPGDEVSVLIGTHRPLEREDMRDYHSVFLQKIELLRSRNFLKNIVKDLSYMFQLKEFTRDSIFDSIHVDEYCIKGKYTFLIDQESNKYILNFDNEQMGFEEKQIRLGHLSTRSEINIPGFFARFKPNFINNPHDFEFKLISMKHAVSQLLQTFTVNSPSLANPSFHISLEGKDLPLITKTINYIADYFIEQDILLRKQRTNQAVMLLQTQLNTADKQRMESLRKLNSFLTQNPDVALDQNLELAANNLVALEANQYQESNTRRDAYRLLASYEEASGNEKLRIVGEILTFLQAREGASAAYLSTEYENLLEEQSELQRHYAKKHPLIQENQQKISQVDSKAKRMLNDFIETLAHNQAEARNQINTLTNKVKSLPHKYTKLAELRRIHQTQSETYASILSKFNEARLATSVEVADFFIIDYAEEPLPTPRIIFYFNLLLLSLIIGLLFALGPVFFHNKFKATVATPYELKKHYNLPLLESLPTVHAFNKKKKGPGPYPRIASSSWNKETGSMQESLRSLSAKLLMNVNIGNDKSFVVCSLEPGTGKSTFAANFAASTARSHLPTLLIDGDLRKGTQSDIFFLNNTTTPGLSELLIDSRPIEKQLIQKYIIQTKIENLHLLTCGAYTQNSFELLSQQRMQDLKILASSIYKVIVFDSPPLGACVDSMAVADFFSCYIPIATAGMTNIRTLSKKMNEFPILIKKSAGIVLNRTPITNETGYYHYTLASGKKPIKNKLTL